MMNKELHSLSILPFSIHSSILSPFNATKPNTAQRTLQSPVPTSPLNTPTPPHLVSTRASLSTHSRSISDSARCSRSIAVDANERTCAASRSGTRPLSPSSVRWAPDAVPAAWPTSCHETAE
eukprot:355302-Chlamydomonas_euryale.AAC.5